MKPCQVFTVISCVLFCAASLMAEAADDLKERVETTLWPGESWTFGGVTITWEFGSEATTDSLGKLRIKGRNATLADFPPSPQTDTAAYIDEIILFATEHFVRDTFGNLDHRLKVDARRIPSKQTFTAEPTRRECAISNVCPISLNQWRLTLSNALKNYPNGEKHLELCALDTESNTQMTMPALGGATRTFGRFQIKISRVYDPSCTAYFEVFAKADTTKRGGDSYIVDTDDLRPQDKSTSCAAYLDWLGKEYGFEVKWLERQDVLEGSEFLNRTKTAPVQYSRSRTGGGILSSSFGTYIQLGPFLSFDWKDATHLEVSPDYAAWIADKQAAQLHADWEKKFQMECALETRSYPLKYTKASAIKNLIEPLLSTYRLLASKSPSHLPGASLWSRHKINNMDMDYPDNRSATVLAKAEERCAADERSNSLLVIATSKTLERVEEEIKILDRQMDQERQAKAAAARFRIEAVLLQGGKAGEKIDDASRVMKLSFSVPGIVKEVPVSSGIKIKMGDAIMRLEPAQQEQQLKLAEIELTQMETLFKTAQNAFVRAKTYSANKVISQEDFEKSEAALKTAEANFGATKVKLEAARGRLSACILVARQSGTIAKVLISPNERAEAGQIVATLIPDEKPAAPPSAKTEEAQGAKATISQDVQADTFSSDLAAQFGLSREDLKLFGFDGVAQLGKGITTLIAERGEAGRTLVALTDEYRCQLEFLDDRPPYLVVKTTLSGPQSEKPLLENTSFLEKGKPAIIGLTNLRQALILVLRLHDAPSAAPTANK
ncbi:MAG: hypothetical protein NTX50_19895 [Candidatus Sumerlaeota bacterium]|nr:hypothetical protein [Candidatus Sumerlaeota bacterium]